jgi:hypothetical protein
LSVSHLSGLHDSAYRDAEPTRRSKLRILPVVYQAKRESRLPPAASLHHDEHYCGREPFYLVWPSECRKQISLRSWLASINLSGGSDDYRSWALMVHPAPGTRVSFSPCAPCRMTISDTLPDFRSKSVQLPSRVRPSRNTAMQGGFGRTEIHPALRTGPGRSVWRLHCRSGMLGPFSCKYLELMPIGKTRTYSQPFAYLLLSFIETDLLAESSSSEKFPFSKPRKTQERSVQFRD